MFSFLAVLQIRVILGGLTEEMILRQYKDKPTTTITIMISIFIKLF